jgi:uncharacterized protein with HEPN domain
MKDRKKANLERLFHVQKAILEIEAFTKTSNLSDFLGNSLLSSAVLHQFNVVGEAIVHVEPSILEKYEYPWFKVRAFRNLISHEYFNVKLEAVWDIVENDLPKLKEIVEIILKDEH